MQKTIMILGVLMVSLLGISLLSGNVVGAPNTVTVKVEYELYWTGNIQGDTGQSINGMGNKTYVVEGDIISASAQKEDDSELPLTISIIINDQVVENSTTTAPHGIASVDYSFPVEEWEGENEGGSCSTVFASLFIFIGAGGVVILKRYHN